MLPFSLSIKFKNKIFNGENAKWYSVVPLDPLKNKITEIKSIFNLCKNELTEKKKK